MHPEKDLNTTQNFINCVDKLLKEYIFAGLIEVTYWWDGPSSRLSLRFRMWIDGKMYSATRDTEESLITGSNDVQNVATFIIEDALIKLALVKKGV